MIGWRIHGFVCMRHFPPAVDCADAVPEDRSVLAMDRLQWTLAVPGRKATAPVAYIHDNVCATHESTEQS
jgi:hypothetical protein